ncbi:MAG: glycosyltransferase family 39 protein, partial [Chloroflexota bacterium]
MSRRTASIWMIPLLLLLTWLVGHHLDIDPIWYDETRTFFYAGWETPEPISVLDTINRVGGSDVQAPVYYVLVNLWGNLAGRDPFTARVISLYASLLAVAVIYRLGGELASARAGLAAAALVGTSAFFVVYAHEARTYALLLFLIGGALLSYWKVMHTGKVAWYVGLLVGMALLPYSHYVALVMFPTMGVYHLLNYRKTGRWWRISGVIVLAGLLFLPWVMLAVQAVAARATFERNTVPTLTLPEILSTVVTEFSNGYAALMLILLVLGLRWRERGNRFIWITGGAMLLFVHLFDQLVPLLNHSRYLIVLWVFVALIAGMGTERLAAQGVPLILIVGVWGSLGMSRAFDATYRLNVNGPGAFGAWDFAADYLEQRAQDGDLVLVHLPADTLYEPFHAPVADYYLDALNVDTNGVESRRLQPDENYIRIGLDRARGEDRIWYIRDMQQVPERHGLFDRAIGETFAHCGTLVDNNSHLVDFYIERPEPDEIEMRFGESIALVPFFDFDRNIPDMALISSGWIVGEDVPPYTYSVALHVVDADNNIVVQADYALPQAGAHCGYGVLDMSTLPA